jgi:hypothetical protein
VGLRDKLKRLERAARGEIIEIPQKDGTVARFPRSAEIEAFRNWFDRLGAGEDAPPEHPMLAAVRNTSEPEWQKTFFYVEDPDAHSRPVPDLSE